MTGLELTHTHLTNPKSRFQFIVKKLFKVPILSKIEKGAEAKPKILRVSNTLRKARDFDT